jgi:hypothetical protein
MTTTTEKTAVARVTLYNGPTFDVRIELSTTPGGAVKMVARTGSLESHKYSKCSGYRYLVVEPTISRWNFSGGEPVKELTVGLNLVKRTSNVKTARDEVRLRSPDAVIFARLPDGSYAPIR